MLVVILQHLSLLTFDGFIIKLPFLNFGIGSNHIILAIAIFLIIKPQFLYLWALLCFIGFFANGFVAGNLLGVLCYFSGILVLLKYGFFKNKAPLKLIVLIAIFLIVFIYQYRNNGIEALKKSLFYLTFAISLFIGIFTLFISDLKHYYTKKEVFNISTLNLTDRQHNCFVLAMQGLTFREIAEKQCISEAVIKKEMTKIYELLNVKDYVGFKVFIKTHEIIE